MILQTSAVVNPMKLEDGTVVYDKLMPTTVSAR